MSRVHRIATVLVASVAIVGCTGQGAPSAPARTSAAPAASSAPPAASSAPAGKAVVGFSQANGGDEWRTNQTNNVKEHCAKEISGAEILVSDAQGKDDVQSSHVDEFISRPVSVLLLTPNTAPGLTEAAKRAMAANIPVITMDRGVDSDVTQHIGADNKLIGKKAAEYVAKNVLGGKPGKVIEIEGTAGASATTDRKNEFHAWLKANAPQVEVVTSVVADYKRDKALAAMNDLLQKYKPGDVQVIYTHNDAMALGVVAALETADRLAEFKVIGIDGQNEAIQAIKDGKIAVTFTYDNAGKEACQTAAKLLKGEKVDKQWVIETNTIDPANVDQWIGKGF